MGGRSRAEAAVRVLNARLLKLLRLWRQLSRWQTSLSSYSAPSRALSGRPVATAAGGDCSVAPGGGEVAGGGVVAGGTLVAAGAPASRVTASALVN